MGFRLNRARWLFAATLGIALIMTQAPALCGQAGHAGRSSPFTEIKWDAYTFKFFPGNQMGQALDADGHVLGTILSQGGGLQVLPTVTGEAAEKLKKSFEAWKEQGGEKALNSATPAARGTSRAPATASASTNASGAPAAPPAETSKPAAPAANAPASAAAAAGASPNRAANSNASAAPAAGEGIVVGGARLGTLSNPMTSAIVRTNLTAYLDMQLLRLQPSLLDEPQVLKYFVMINNCVYNTEDAPTRLNDTAVRKLMRNELDYPQAAEYYRTHAAEILATLPRTTVATIGSSQLGEYDTAKNVFPLVSMVGKQARPLEVKLQQREIMRAAQGVTARSGVSGMCMEAGTQRIIIETKGQVGRNYALDVEKEMTFSQVPVNLETARRLIDAGWNRIVRFDAEFELLDDPKPAMLQSCAHGNSVPCVAFATRVKKITVVKPGSFPAMGKIVPDEDLAVVYP